MKYLIGALAVSIVTNYALVVYVAYLIGWF